MPRFVTLTVRDGKRTEMMSADQALTHLELLVIAHKTMRGGSCVVQGQLDPFEVDLLVAQHQPGTRTNSNLTMTA
jgi:hypothetical protein